MDYPEYASLCIYESIGMPSRHVAARELANVYKVLAHPDRIRLVEELKREELDVKGLAALLDLPVARVSQHLSILRAHRLVEERRDGRRHIYCLTQPELANWIVQGLDFVEGQIAGLSLPNINQARRLWTRPTPKSSSAS